MSDRPANRRRGQAGTGWAQLIDYDLAAFGLQQLQLPRGGDEFVAGAVVRILQAQSGGHRLNSAGISKLAQPSRHGAGGRSIAQVEKGAKSIQADCGKDRGAVIGDQIQSLPEGATFIQCCANHWPLTLIALDVGKLMLCQPDELTIWMETDRKLAILDLRSPEDYARGHVPDAVNLNVSDYHPIIRNEEQRVTATRTLVEMFRSAGVDNDTTVVLYQAFTGYAACRAYWMLDYLGHRRAFILDGGYRNWADFGKLIDVKHQPLPGGGNLSPNPRQQVLATADYIRERIKSGATQVIDMRTIDEYDGTDSRDNPRHGHIPGAIWMNWEMLIGPDGRMRTEREIAAEFSHREISRDKEVIVYCNGGARSACGYVGLQRAGYSNFRNYFGSWHEWSRQNDLPIEHPIFVAK